MLQAKSPIRRPFTDRRPALLAGALVASLAMLGTAATVAPPTGKAQVAAALPATDVDRDGTSMYRYPDISDHEIVFVYANDLWRVPIEGGTALPLASPPGTEGMPRFSPSGDEVAWSRMVVATPHCRNSSNRARCARSFACFSCNRSVDGLS